MSRIKEHFEKELAILRSTLKGEDDKLVIEDFIPQIKTIINKFSKQGHSGGSAPYYIHAIAETIRKTLEFKPLSEITGDESEWNDISEYDAKGTYQNNRCSGIFKYADGKCSYVDGLVKRTQDGATYHGPFWLNEEAYLNKDESKRYGCSTYIKSFPFTPKTFTVDVIEKEVAPDDWEMWLKNPDQLKEIEEYYDLKPIKTQP